MRKELNRRQRFPKKESTQVTLQWAPFLVPLLPYLRSTVNGLLIKGSLLTSIKLSYLSKCYYTNSTVLQWQWGKTLAFHKGHAQTHRAPSSSYWSTSTHPRSTRHLQSGTKAKTKTIDAVWRNFRVWREKKIWKKELASNILREVKDANAFGTKTKTRLKMEYSENKRSS